MAKTICSFSLQFPPLNGVDLVLDGNILQFQLRVGTGTNYENQGNSVNVSVPGKPVPESLIVTEAQLGLILGLIEAHRRAYTPPR